MGGCRGQSESILNIGCIQSIGHAYSARTFLGVLTAGSSDDEDDPYALPQEEEGGRADPTVVPDIDYVRHHSQASASDIVGPHHQTRAVARAIAVNHARVNIKVARVSDAFLAQQNRDLDANTVQEAMRLHDWPRRKEAMDDLLGSFYKLEVWDYAKLPPKADMVKCKCLCEEV